MCFAFVNIIYSVKMQRHDAETSIKQTPKQWDRSFMKARHPTGRASDTTKPRSLNWPIVFFLIGIPVGTILSLLWVPVYKETILMMPAWMIFRTLAITGGEYLSKFIFCHLVYFSNQ